MVGRILMEDKHPELRVSHFSDGYFSELFSRSKGRLRSRRGLRGGFAGIRQLPPQHVHFAAQPHQFVELVVGRRWRGTGLSNLATIGLGISREALDLLAQRVVLRQEL